MRRLLPPWSSYFVSGGMLAKIVWVVEKPPKILPTYLLFKKVLTQTFALPGSRVISWCHSILESGEKSIINLKVALINIIIGSPNENS